MKTLKLSGGISLVAFLVGWRLWVVVGNLDPQIYDAIVQAAPNLVVWVKVSIVALGCGFLIIAGYAIFNEFEHSEKQAKSYNDMRQHVEKELSASLTRKIKSSFREREEELERWQVKLEIVDKEHQERARIILMRGQNLEACRRQLEADRADIIPLRCGYEDARATLDSYIVVTKDDQAEVTKILDKALKWVMLAVDDPQKFVSESKAERINRGWLEKYERKLKGIEVRADGTKQEAEAIYANIADMQKKPMAHSRTEMT